MLVQEQRRLPVDSGCEEDGPPEGDALHRPRPQAPATDPRRQATAAPPDGVQLRPATGDIRRQPDRLPDQGVNDPGADPPADAGDDSNHERAAVVTVRVRPSDLTTVVPTMSVRTTVI